MGCDARLVPRVGTDTLRIRFRGDTRARVCAIVYLLEVHFHIFPTVIFAPSAAGRGRARGFNEKTIKRNLKPKWGGEYII